MGVLAVRGVAGAIPRALKDMLPEGEEMWPIGRDEEPPPLAQRYLFAAGVLHGLPITGQTRDHLAETAWANFHEVARACERIIAGNDGARICVIGSESAYTGSYDAAYAGAKAALHAYVETRRLRSPLQQLVCVAPTVISDAGMTLRREDHLALRARADAHPKKRWLLAREVAAMVKFLLYDDAGYTTGVVIRMHGGAPCGR